MTRTSLAGSGSRTWIASLILAASLVIGLAGTASAYYVSSETGLVGPYSLTDTSGSPDATCSYAFAGSDQGVDTYLLDWMRLKPPTVRAADRNSDRRDTRIVSWQFVLARNVGPGYQIVGKSPVQRARAYEDKAAAFTAMKVFHDAASVDEQFQARMTIKWHKPNGSVEGKVVLWIQFYRVKDSPIVTEDTCWGGYQRA